MEKNKTLPQIIESKAEALGKALPHGMSIERFTRIAMSAVRNNPKLAKCTTPSLLGSLMTCAQLGLEPNTPLKQCYIIPYCNKGIFEAQFQIGYKGVLNLAYRHGKIDAVEAQCVFEKDELEFEYGTSAFLKHRRAKTNRGDMAYIYAMYTTTAGNKVFTVWSYEEIIEHAKQYSGSWDQQKNDFRYSSAWNTAFSGMAKKTVVIDLMKLAPQAAEFDLMQQAVGLDNRIVNFNEYENGDSETVVGDSDFTDSMVGFEK